LQPGDEVIVSIEGIGELRNPVVAELTKKAICIHSS
jgi:2-keto-4-pentenoate hydratase/2-oxohepta-3-ene-1,7-dioic acid hydratase in catechol pathway